MNRFFISSKFLVAATLATAALGATTLAEAHPEVYVSLGFQSAPVWVQPARGYYAEPPPVYVQPAPFYARPPVFVAPREVFEGPRFGRYEARRQWERERAWRRTEWLRHQRHEEFRGGDRDHDYDRGDRKYLHDRRD